MNRSVRLRTGILLVVAMTLIASRSAPALSLVGARGQIGYYSWTLTGPSGTQRSLCQLFTPVVTTLSQNPTTHLVLSTAGAISRYETHGDGSRSLDGFSNLRIQGYHKLAENRILLFGGISLPSGKTDLNDDELVIARTLSHPLLGIPLKQLGRGFELSGGVAVPIPLRPGLQLGIGAGFLYSGPYALWEGQEDYYPTPSASISLGLELKEPRWPEHVSESSIRATYRIYSKDKLGQDNVFEEGNQLDLVVEAKGRRGAFGASLLSQAIFKARNTSFMKHGSQIEAFKHSSGSGYLLSLTLHRRVSAGVRAGIEGHWRHFRGCDFPDKNGYALGIGPMAELPLGRQNWLRLRIHLLTGSAGEGDEQLDLRGHSAIFSVVWRP